MPAATASPRIALVLPGGGARGAYEAGALSVLLPELEARGERPAIFCGTSVGAINAAYMASVAHLPGGAQAEGLVRTWRAIRKGDVIQPLVGPHLPLTALRFAGDLLELPGVRLAALMDPAPLRRSLERWIDWVAVQRNVRSRAAEALCVVATALTRGGPVGFVHTAGAMPRHSASDELRYVRVGAMKAEHVRASAAIPMLFPPVEVTTPHEAADHYIDGGTRVNSPIAPALALGAERVVVIGFEPFAARSPAPRPAAHPRLADVTANILDGLLVDQVADDLHRLAAINAFFVEGAGAGGVSSSARAYRAAEGKTPYRRISYALVAPSERGALAALAEEAFERRYGGWRGLLQPDYPLLSRLLGGGRTRSRGELLSFLLFDEHHIEALVQAGAADAQAWLARHPRFWCADAEHDLHIDPARTELARERVALDEFRALRRGR
jgi:NTE family protein